MSESVVYFVQAGNYIKIGTTTNLRARLAALQNGSPFPISLLHTIPGDTEKEKAFQRQFHKSRIRGEWYEVTPELRQFIETGIIPRPPAPMKQTINEPAFQPNFVIEPLGGVISVNRHVPQHAKGEDVIAHIKFHTYLVIAAVVEADVQFDTLNVTFTYPLSGEGVEVARAAFTREQCWYIATPYVHFFGALAHATSVTIHPAFEPWEDFPPIVMDQDGRPIVDRLNPRLPTKPNQEEPHHGSNRMA